jgi:hypothetical protein
LGAGKCRVDGAGPGQAEVEDFHDAFGREENVLGLQVPVDDPFAVRCGEAARDLDHGLDGLAGGHRTMDAHDVGVREGRDRARLAFEARQSIAITGQFVGQDFDRHLAAEPFIAGSVHRAHPAGAQKSEDLVGAQASAGSKRHGVAGHCKGPRPSRLSGRRCPYSAAGRRSDSH